MKIPCQIFKEGLKWGMLEKNPFENNVDAFFMKVRATGRRH
jgi:hypothetical protein